MSLSVRSIESCGPATARFSMAGILWPFFTGGFVVGKPSSSVDSICSFQMGKKKRTSEVNLALFERVEVGEGRGDEVGG